MSRYDGLIEEVTTSNFIEEKTKDEIIKAIFEANAFWLINEKLVDVGMLKNSHNVFFYNNQIDKRFNIPLEPNEFEFLRKMFEEKK